MSQKPLVLDIITGTPIAIDCMATLCPDGCNDSCKGIIDAQMDEKLGREKGSSEKLITYVKDRPGHDRRYAIDATKINKELGWAPSVTFEEGLAITIDWYLSNAEWLKNVTSGTYQEYYDNMYAKR